MSDPPIVSVITSNFNDGSLLRETVQCIRTCSYPSIEYIVIDGGSTDCTLDVLSDAGALVDKFVSEPDQGIFDAWNKAIRIASGQYIAFLGAGDTYVEGGLEKLVACALSNPDIDFVSSKIAIVRNGVVRRVCGISWRWDDFRHHMKIAHPGSLHSRRLFEIYGEFDTSYRIAGDYEFLLRPRDALKAAFVDDVTVRMVAGGISQADYRVFQEVESAKIKNCAVTPWIARVDRYIEQSKQWVRSNFLD